MITTREKLSLEQIARFYYLAKRYCSRKGYRDRYRDVAHEAIAICLDNETEKLAKYGLHDIPACIRKAYRTIFGRITQKRKRLEKQDAQAFREFAQRESIDPAIVTQHILTICRMVDTAEGRRKSGMLYRVRQMDRIASKLAYRRVMTTSLTRDEAQSRLEEICREERNEQRKSAERLFENDCLRVDQVEMEFRKRTLKTEEPEPFRAYEGQLSAQYKYVLSDGNRIGIEILWKDGTVHFWKWVPGRKIERELQFPPKPIVEQIDETKTDVEGVPLARIAGPQTSWTKLRFVEVVERSAGYWMLTIEREKLVYVNTEFPEFEKFQIRKLKTSHKSKTRATHGKDGKPVTMKGTRLLNPIDPVKKTVKERFEMTSEQMAKMIERMHPAS